MKIKNDRLTNVRLKASLTQFQLSELTGIPVRTIRAYEQGTRKFDNANISHAIKIAYALDCRLEDILEDCELVSMLRYIDKWN